MKYDQATIKREKLQYARILLEVHVDKELSDDISFINEKDQLTKVKVDYEWKPILCQTCKGLGHNTNECRKNVCIQEWRQKVTNVEVAHKNDGTVKELEQDFQRVRNPARRLISSPAPVGTQNEFTPLKETVTEVVVGFVQCTKVNNHDKGGSIPPDING